MLEDNQALFSCFECQELVTDLVVVVFIPSLSYIGS